jgi:hypothetical protein
MIKNNSNMTTLEFVMINGEKVPILDLFRLFSTRDFNYTELEFEIASQVSDKTGLDSGVGDILLRTSELDIFFFIVRIVHETRVKLEQHK